MSRLLPDLVFRAFEQIEYEELPNGGRGYIRVCGEKYPIFYDDLKLAKYRSDQGIMRSCEPVVAKVLCRHGVPFMNPEYIAKCRAYLFAKEIV